ncbi:rho-related GTP-binding protein RhoE-like [Pomacea canaliculata]|uniref:rho-related GTP-binding protein RhoE-like n=1 Tax=Pomacea canaliculata TaxID=400727 RepID=UPI000D72C100|nr:rho-related GTP-binding protein RhoE-like [Pomacea canaliculata]
MKDKVCSDFVFMPLKGDQRVPTTMAAGDKGVTKDKVVGTKDRSVGSVAAASASSSAVAGATGGDVTVVKSKIVVVGDCECGKTALIHRYVHSKFLESYTPTGFDTYSGSYSVSDSYRIQMSIWDTSGDTGYDRVRPLSYTDADLVILCFAIDSPDSMENVVSKWYPEVRENCPTQPIMLVGCKTDRRSEAKNLPAGQRRPTFVSYDQGLKTAKHIGALVYSETSAKTSQRSVNDVMEVAALSSAGTTNTAAAAGASPGCDGPSSFRRQRSFIRRKRFSGLTEAKVHLRKEAAKSCVVM